MAVPFRLYTLHIPSIFPLNLTPLISTRHTYICILIHIPKYTHTNTFKHTHKHIQKTACDFSKANFDAHFHNTALNCKRPPPFNAEKIELSRKYIKYHWYFPVRFLFFTLNGFGWRSKKQIKHYCNSLPHYQVLIDRSAANLKKKKKNDNSFRIKPVLTCQRTHKVYQSYRSIFFLFFSF